MLDQRGQSSVEAVVVLPTLMLIFALLLEPACMGYTLTVMKSAAAEAARIEITREVDTSYVDAFVQKRLEAIPEVSPFHVGGQSDWDISVKQEGAEAIVKIKGHARPLPLFGVVSSPFLTIDATGVVLEVEVRERMRASWVGGDYESWQTIWS